MNRVCSKNIKAVIEIRAEKYGGHLNWKKKKWTHKDVGKSAK